MNWISVSDLLPTEGSEVSVKFEHPECTDECEGFAFYIDGKWQNILAFTCCAHGKDSEKLKDQIAYWRVIDELD